MEVNNELTRLSHQIDQKLEREKNKRLPWRLIIVGITVTIGISSLVVAAFVAGMKFSGFNRNPPTVVEQSQEPTPTPDPTAGWKDYATPWYSFKISPQWQEVESEAGESGIILVTTNLDYTDFGNVKTGALIYVPIGQADEQILDAILSENLRRGYKLISKQQIELDQVKGTEMIIESPSKTQETQFRFFQTDNRPMFLSLVAAPGDKDRYYQEFRLMLSTLKLLTPQNLSHFSHPEGLFEVDYPSEMKIEKVETTLSSYENIEDWEFGGIVTLSVEQFRSRSVEDEAKRRYQKVVTENRVGTVFSTRVVNSQTALQYTELTPEGKRLTKVYLDLPGDFILIALYYDEVESKLAAETILDSLRMP